MSPHWYNENRASDGPSLCMKNENVGTNQSAHSWREAVKSQEEFGCDASHNQVAEQQNISMIDVQWTGTETKSFQ